MNTSNHLAVAETKGVQGHTPGPWRLSSMYPARVCGEREGHTFVANCHSNDDPDDAEDWANARLIAVAPELLEVARLLALATDEGDDAAQGTHYVDKDGRIRCKGSFLATIEQARAAYAMATGSTT
jgi:hypothetical protein